MSRSSNKGYYVDQKLLKKIRNFSDLNLKKEEKSLDTENKENSSASQNLPKNRKNVVKKSKVSTPGAFKTWSRSSVVHPEMIGKILSIHNGKEHKEVSITSGMVGLKLGALVQTRKRGIHGKAGKR